MEKKFYQHPGCFELECGGKINRMVLCYHISKTFSPEKKNIWITHALTANSDPTDWWSGLCGPGRFFDTQRYNLICANVLGSCYGSTGPCSIDPETGKPHLLDFPATTVRDIARCHELLREYLHIPQIDLLIGGSVGGFQALEWSIMYPERIRNLVLLACNARFTPWGSAFNESMRMALHADSSFAQAGYRIAENGQAEALGGKAGLQAARSIALLSYRSYKGYNSTQQEPDPDCLFPSRAASYQRYQGRKLSERFDAYSYLSLLNLTDSHNVGRGRGGIPRALSRIQARTLCIGIDSDGLFPETEQRSMAAHIPGGKYMQITSSFGHDGFLLEGQQIRSAIENEKMI